MRIQTLVTRLRYNFWLDEELRDGLKAIKDRDGILESEQIRRAIQLWLKEKGVGVKSDRRPAANRSKRS